VPVYGLLSKTVIFDHFKTRPMIEVNMKENQLAFEWYQTCLFLRKT